MKLKGIVKTQSNKSELAKLIMKMFLGLRILGFKMTFGQLDYDQNQL